VSGKVIWQRPFQRLSDVAITLQGCVEKFDATVGNFFRYGLPVFIVLLMLQGAVHNQEL
jgi:hypothetical protein